MYLSNHIDIRQHFDIIVHNKNLIGENYIMTTFLAEKTGRVLLIHLTKGDDLLRCISKAVEEHGIKTGIVTSAIGSLRKFSYHYIKDNNDTPTDIFEDVEGPLELVTAEGLVIEGKPHLHALVSEYGSKRTISGHLEEGSEIQYLAEISIVELPNMPIGRRVGKCGKIANIEWTDGR